VFILAIGISLICAALTGATYVLFGIRPCQSCEGIGVDEQFCVCKACDGRGILFRVWRNWW
jgi:DnaJ-class molecular chaperone